MLRAISLLLLVSLVSILTRGDNPQVITLTDHTKDFLIQDITYVQDSTQQFKAGNIANAPFKDYDPTNPPVIDGPKTFWVHTIIKNTSNTHGAWVFEFEGWSYVDFYTPMANGNMEARRTGHRVPYHQRDYPFANRNLILLELDPGQQLDAYIRLEYLFNNERKPKNLDFQVTTHKNQIFHNRSMLQWSSVFIGIYAVMLLYNLFVYFSTRDRSYLYYLLLLSILIYAAFYNSGLIIPAFASFENFPDFLTSVVRHFMSPIFAMAGIWFTQSFLHTKERYPKWHKYFNILIYILIPLIPMQYISNAVYEMTLGLIGLVGMIAFFSILIVGIKSAIDKFPSAVYFVIGYSFFIFGTLISTLAITGVIDNNSFTFSYSISIGSAIEMVMFSFALANRINVLKQENEVKQQKIISQLQENEALQTKVNRELEQKVEERTSEIMKQKEIIEQEKEKSDNLLLNILPKSTAEELKVSGHATPQHYEKVTVLFMDVKDFTKIAERMTADEVVKNLDDCFQEFDEIVARNNLEKIKTIGDAYMCAGGIPEPNTSNPIDAINAAFEMMQFVKDWNEKKLINNELQWEFRIGIHTGPVTAGVVGKKKFAYDIWGDAVNLASRMESSGEAGKINVSEATWELVKDQFKGTARGKINVKNKGQVGMYFVDMPAEAIGTV